MRGWVQVRPIQKWGEGSGVRSDLIQKEGGGGGGGGGRGKEEEPYNLI